MNSEIIKEVNVFLHAIALGAGAGLVYDVLRVLRRVKTRGTLLTGIEDLLYWAAAAIVLFVFLYRENGGIIRAYVIVGMAAGMITYEIVLGRLIVKYLSIILKKVVSFFDKIFGKILKMFSFLLKKCLKPFKILISKFQHKKSERVKKKEYKKECKKRRKNESEKAESKPLKRGVEVENGKRKQKGKKKGK